jgi:hypothetical protein
MKGYSFVMFIVISLGFLSHAQVQERNPFIEYSQANFSIGSIYGVHPKYTRVSNTSYFQEESNLRYKIASLLHYPKNKSKRPFINVESLSVYGSLPPSSISNYELSKKILKGKSSFGKSIIGIGSSNGVHPNFRFGNGSNFVSGSLNQDFSIKGIPINFSGRISNEPYITGRASYFRFSYQGVKMKKHFLDSLESMIRNLENEKQSKLQEIYQLESKLGYLTFVLNEYPIGDSVPLPNLPNLDSLVNDLPNEVSVSIDDSCEACPQNKIVALPSVDNHLTLEKVINLIEFALSVKNQEVDQLDLNLAKLNLDFQNASLQRYENFFKGISKFEIGLSSLPSAHLSSNAIPIQGLKIGGKYHKWTYNVAAGMTVTNKVFSNAALDQVLNNTANLFNLSNFYQVNSVRLVQATILEYGEVAKNSMFVENYYTGPSMDKFKVVSKLGSANGTNIGGYYTPKFAPNLTASATIGISVRLDDSLNRKLEDHLMFAASLKYSFSKLRSEFAAKYRRLGTEYNGFAQGIYISGVSHFESFYRQNFGRRFAAKFTYAHDEFSNMDSLIRFSYLNQATLDLTYKLTQKSVIYGSGALIQTDESLGDKLSYQLRFGLFAEKEFKKVAWQTNLESQYAKMIGVDSNQILAQASLKSGLYFNHWGYTLKGTVQHFEGIGRLIGTNIIIQPELSYRYASSTLNLSGQYLISDQFGSDLGLSLNWMYKPSPHVQWNLILQKWLISESRFFAPVADFSYQPFYANFQMLIFLKN